MWVWWAGGLERKGGNKKLEANCQVGPPVRDDVRFLCKHECGVYDEAV